MEALSDSSWASSGGDSDDINIMGDGFSDAKDYEVLQHIGGGTFGEVVKAQHKSSGRVVALKRVWQSGNPFDGGSGGCGDDGGGALGGLPQALLREVHALRAVQHANVVQLLHTFKLGTSLALEMECCCTDVAVLLKAARARGAPLPKPVVQLLARQLLSAVAACHAVGVLHRDVKPANLLLREDGSLALADFGQARPHSAAAGAPVSSDKHAHPAAAGAPAANGRGPHTSAPGGSSLRTADAAGGAAAAEAVDAAAAADAEAGSYTAAVATRWYRAPELLLGCRRYGCAVDVWAGGCTFAELLGGSPLLPGESDIDQLGRVASLFGGLSTQLWPGLAAAPDFAKLRFRPVPKQDLAALLPGEPPPALALLEQMLHLDPEERPSAAEALQHPYFTAASAGDYETAAQQLRAEVAGAAAFADAERQQRRAELAAFEQELAALSS